MLQFEVATRLLNRPLQQANWLCLQRTFFCFIKSTTYNVLYIEEENENDDRTEELTRNNTKD